MKDLGYPRTPTDAKLRVTMPDRSVWEIPVQVIADHRDAHYEALQEGGHMDTVASVRSFGPSDIRSWARHRMSWRDLEDQAVMVGYAPTPDYNEAWLYAPISIVGQI